jgi:hypothetical protein
MSQSHSFKSYAFILYTSVAALSINACSSDSTSSTGRNGGPGNDDIDSGASNGNAGHGNVNDDDGGVNGNAGANGGGSDDGGTSGNIPGADGGAEQDAGGTGGDTVGPIGLAEEDFDTAGMNDDDALASLVGTYDVVIYMTEAGQDSDIGAGTIDVAYDGDIVTLTLQTGGDTVVTVQNSRMNPVNYGQAAFTQVLGKILVDDRDSEFSRIDVTLAPGGSIYGYVGGVGEFYKFRNNVVHYGPTLPQHLLAQVGTWTGPQLAGTCDRPPVTLEVAADGSVVLSGTANLDCMEAEVTNQWDGQDDYVVPRPYTVDQVEIVIDGASGGGSAPGGGITLDVPADPTVAGIFNARTTLSGFQGNIEFENPEKQ